MTSLLEKAGKDSTSSTVSSSLFFFLTLVKNQWVKHMVLQGDCITDPPGIKTRPVPVSSHRIVINGHL